jgi:hypothetical protein
MPEMRSALPATSTFQVVAPLADEGMPLVWPLSKESQMTLSPNKSLQRTPLRAPLSRKPSGGQGK